MSVNVKGMFCVSIVIGSGFGQFTWKGGRIEKPIVMVVSLFASTKSAYFCGSHVGLFWIGAKDTCSWLLLPLLSN